MAPDVFQQKGQLHSSRRLPDFQNQVRDKEERLEYASNQAVNQIVNNLLVVSQEVAKERGLNAVIARQTLLVFEPGMDITKPVLDKLNARLPSVRVPESGYAPAQRCPGQPIGAAAPTAAACSRLRRQRRPRRQSRNAFTPYRRMPGPSASSRVPVR